MNCRNWWCLKMNLAGSMCDENLGTLSDENSRPCPRVREQMICGQISYFLCTYFLIIGLKKSNWFLLKFNLFCFNILIGILPNSRKHSYLDSHNQNLPYFENYYCIQLDFFFRWSSPTEKSIFDLSKLFCVNHLVAFHNVMNWKVKMGGKLFCPASIPYFFFFFRCCPNISSNGTQQHLDGGKWCLFLFHAKFLKKLFSI